MGDWLGTGKTLAAQEFDVTFSGVALPTNTSGTLYLYEDVGGDGSGPNSVTVGGTTVNYENSDSVALSDGQTSYTLSGFNGSSGNVVYPRIELTNSDVEVTADITEALGVPASTVTISESGSVPTTATVSGTETASATESGSIDATVTLSGSVTAFGPPGVRWKAEIVGTGTTESNLIDVEVTDSIDRYARSATLTIEDTDGTAKSRYPRGERVEVFYSTDSGANYTRRWAGTPADWREKEDAGDVLEVELVGYDFFIRKEDVYRTFSSGTSFKTVLKETIKNFTPIEWVPGNVELVANGTLDADLSFAGEKPDQIIDEISVASGNEEFGVNDDFEFFFRPRDVMRAPVDILGDEWIDYDLPEEAKRSVNKVRLFYDSGNDRASLVVQDRAVQQELKNKLNAEQNVVLGTSATYPGITSEQAARRKANQILNNRGVIQTGDVTSFARFDNAPGDVFRLVIPDKQIDDDFRIAEVTFRWRDDETVFTVAEQTEGTSDELLASLADDVSRLDARDADPDAPTTQDLNLTSGVTVASETVVSQRTLASDAFIVGAQRSEVGAQRDTIGVGIATATRDARTDTRGVLPEHGLNDLRDVVSGGTPATRTHLAVGSGDTPVNRTDNTLDSELQRVRTSGPRRVEGNGIEYEAVLPAGGPAAASDVTNYGLFTAASGGEMHQETRTDALTHASDTETVIRIRMRLDDNPDLEGVVPDVGRDRWRDLWADLSSDNPADMRYGTGTTDAADGDTALGTQIFEAPIDAYNDRETGIVDVIERLGESEANGNDIAEIGEATTDDTLFTRVTFEPISKTSSFALRIRHRLRASNA